MIQHEYKNNCGVLTIAHKKDVVIFSHSIFGFLLQISFKDHDRPLTDHDIDRLLKYLESD